MLMACILLSNIGASITEVATDALVAEYGQKHRIGGLQSYASMALAIDTKYTRPLQVSKKVLIGL
ncbi:unnamed protein product [Linum tenue]|uniref:Uncharacterized protein n=1 Tax=Linum tenue TaxID=586396 RepID=A0AAV0LRW9_9ROSI|nr:unnamed protein product [Linum tenue]